MVYRLEKTGYRYARRHDTGFRDMSPLTVALGSLNPVKLAATRAAVGRVFPLATVASVDVQSSGPAQPIGDDAAAAGALERADGARRVGDADYGIGLEGGVRQLPGGGWGVCAWAAVVDGDGRVALGGGPIVPLPASAADQVLAGEELGSVMDRLVGAPDTRKGAGAYGILTGGLLDRTMAFEQALLVALTQFVRPEAYR
jgi:inosine/xanthosine triphosphatase